MAKHIILNREDYKVDEVFEKLLRDLGATGSIKEAQAAAVLVKVESITTTTK